MNDTNEEITAIPYADLNRLFLTIREGRLQAFVQPRAMPRGASEELEYRLVFDTSADVTGAEAVGRWLYSQGARNWLHSSSLDHPEDEGAPAIDFHEMIHNGYKAAMYPRPLREVSHDCWLRYHRQPWFVGVGEADKTIVLLVDRDHAATAPAEGESTLEGYAFRVEWIDRPVIEPPCG